MDYAELLDVRDRLLSADPFGPLFRAETNVRLAKGFGWWTAAQDDDGVAVTINLEGGGKRTVFLEGCTVETMFADPKNVKTLALSTQDYCGSIDITRRLIVDYCKHMCSISMSEDPSGAGCKFVWWPNGIHDTETSIQTRCVHMELQLAMLWCFVEAVLKHSWYMKTPESVVNTDKELVHG